MQRITVNGLGSSGLAVLRPGIIAGMPPECAVEFRTTGIMPADKQAVAEHVVDEKPIDYRDVTLKMLHRAVKARLQNHPNLQLGRDDGRRFQGFHEGCRVADTADRPIVDLPVNIIGKLKDRARLKFRYAIRFKELVKIRFYFIKAGYIAVKDIPIGSVYCKRDDKYPAMGTRNRTGKGMLQDRPVPVMP